MRQDVEFAAEDGVPLRAWLYLPDGRAGSRVPAITMAHGYACTRRHGIEPAAWAFAEAGFAVLLHDHRGFGNSGGEPRGDVDPWRQIADWRRAVSFLEARPEVDPERIGLWGSSFAGGHALVLGATDRRLKAVVAQIPTTFGYESALRRVPPGEVAAMERRFAEDDRAQLAGAPPATLPLVSAEPGATAAYRDPVAARFYLDHAPEEGWSNQVTLRSIRAARMYSPAEFIGRVAPTPLLMIVGDRDTTTLTDLGLRAYRDALEPKRLELFRGDHFDAYEAAFGQTSRAAVSWFERHLAGG